jgi:integrase
VDRVLEVVERHELADSTRSRYVFAWDTFQSWCEAHELTSLPASPLTVQLYFVELTGAALGEDGVVRLVRRATSLDVYMAAIRWAHRKGGVPTPTGHRSVKALVRVLNTAEQPAVNKARPLMIEDIKRVAAALPSDLDPLFARAWTATLFGFFGCFRGGEVVSTRLEHLTFSPAGLLVFVPRSKGDQFGQGAWVGIARRSEGVCPVRQVESWVESLPAGSVWLFPSPLTPGRPISFMTLSTDIEKVCGRAFEDISGFSTHSLRRGFCTSAAEAGQSLLSIALKARHQSCSTTVGYIQSGPGEAVQAVAEALGL